MEVKYESILLSEPFKFIIGPQKKMFTIHGAAISKLSKSLDDLLNGSMREANERCVIWEDVDEKTFLRFSQWAYTGEYISAEPEFILASAQLASLKKGSVSKASGDDTASSLASFKIVNENEKNDLCNNCRVVLHTTHGTQCGSCRKNFSTLYCGNCGIYQQTSCLQCRKTPEKLSKKQCMIQKFTNSRGFPSPTIPYTPRKNEKSFEEYSEVFLSHARLYTLADKYDIPDLGKLSLHKIYVSLKEFTLYPSRVGDVINLATYSFENTITGDKLRTLLVDYCACVIEDMLECEGFKELVDKSSDFAFALMKKMKNRLD